MVIFSENLPWNTINFLDTLWYFIPLIHLHLPTLPPMHRTHYRLHPTHRYFLTHNWLKHFIPTQSININTVAFKTSFINMILSSKKHKECNWVFYWRAIQLYKLPRTCPTLKLTKCYHWIWRIMIIIMVHHSMLTM